jgi:hypothetical protein
MSVTQQPLDKVSANVSGAPGHYCNQFAFK